MTETLTYNVPKTHCALDDTTLRSAIEEAGYEAA
jgi:hypothetical protein